MRYELKGIYPFNSTFLGQFFLNSLTVKSLEKEQVFMSLYGGLCEVMPNTGDFYVFEVWRGKNCVGKCTSF